MTRRLSAPSIEDILRIAMDQRAQKSGKIADAKAIKALSRAILNNLKVGSEGSFLKVARAEIKAWEKSEQPNPFLLDFMRRKNSGNLRKPNAAIRRALRLH